MMIIKLPAAAVTPCSGTPVPDGCDLTYSKVLSM